MNAHAVHTKIGGVDKLGFFATIEAAFAKPLSQKCYCLYAVGDSI
jgi:hypothetical protein